MIALCCDSKDKATEEIRKKLVVEGVPFACIYINDFSDSTHPQFAISSNSLKNTVSEVDLNSIKVIYYRLVFYPYLQKINMEQRHVNYLNRELATLWFGQLLALDSDQVWVNHPFYCHLANYKINQLTAAQKIGLTVPEIIASTDRFELFTFFQKVKRRGGLVVTKAIDAGIVESDTAGEKEYVFTQTVDFQTLEEIPEGIPVLLQEHIDSEYEIRCFVIGNRVICIKVTSSEPYIDYRLVDSDKLFAHQFNVPGYIETALLRLTRYYKLNYSAIDLLYKNGEYFFIDFNPIGMWQWYEQASGVSISDAIVDFLIKSLKT